MSKPIHDPWKYFFDARRFAIWHRRTLHDQAKAIDVDLNGYCVRCLRPIYLIEATSSSESKPSSVIQALAEAADCRAFVARVEPSKEPPGEWPWSSCAVAVTDMRLDRIKLIEVWPLYDDMGWMTSESVAAFLGGVRGEHESACRSARLGRARKAYDQHVLGGET